MRIAAHASRALGVLGVAKVKEVVVKEQAEEAVATEATPEATLEAVTLEVELEATLEVCSAPAMQVTEAAQSGMAEV